MSQHSLFVNNSNSIQTNKPEDINQVDLKLLTDCPDKLSLLASLWHHELVLNWYTDTSLKKTTNKLAQHLNRSHLPVTIVALHNDLPVGMICLNTSLGIQENLKPWAGGLVVEPSYRKKGIGRLLINAAKSQALLFKYETLYLFSFEGRLSNWYINMGWSKLGADKVSGHLVDILGINLIDSSALTID